MPGPNLEAIGKARSELGKREAALQQSLEALRRASRDLDEAQRRDGPAAERAALADAAAEARARHDARLNALGEAADRLDVLLDPVRSGPDQQMATQDRAFPVALLPVRIETRLKQGKLLVRIYPDQLHLHRHGATIGTAEARAARAYWRSVGDGEDEETAWTRLAGVAGAYRARFLAAQLQPDASGTAPRVDTVDKPVAPRAEARLLPTAWCVTFLDAQGNVLLRNWSKPVPERLAMSPAGDLLDSLDTNPDGELVLDPDARWLINFKDALDRGMALEIAPAEFGPQGFPAAISRVVVVGSNWSMTAEAGAAALADQLLAHSFSDGFRLPAHGTPTNRSDAAKGVDPMPRPAASAEPLAPAGDLDRLSSLLGLPAEASGLAGTPGTARSYETTARALHTALWGASFGFYLGQVLNPVVPEDAVGDTRVHVRDFLRPAGPLPIIQVGRQPYGVLPVLATPVRIGRIDALPGYDGQLARVLARARAIAEGYSAEAIATGALPQHERDVLAEIPSLHSPGVRPADEVLADILKLGPVARTARVRPTLSAAERDSAKESIGRLEQLHFDVVRLLLSNLAGGLMISPWHVPLIFQLVVPGRPRYRLDGIPWVSADLETSEQIAQAVARMQKRIADAAGNPASIRRLLAVAADEAGTLLEGLLLLSGAFEYWEAGTRAIAGHIEVTASALTATPMAASARLASANLIGFEPGATAQGKLGIESIAQLLTVSGPATQGRPLITHLQDLLTAPDNHPEVRDIHAFNEALAVLAGRPAREVDLALRGLLDAGSHRLDAWITSLATRRLAEQRSARPTGIHVGCYGIVHDLKLDPGHQSSEGYVHLPSADHAVTAAVLRSGHLANQQAGHDPFAIQLTSSRVREALAIVEGMAAGQPASALLGYRFERWLIEDRRTAKYIGPLRQLKPLPFDADPPAGITEALPARDVVDGLALAEAWESNEAQLLDALEALTNGPIDPPLNDVFKALVDLKDAFLDLWVSEAAHQMILGNQPRMTAALATLDRQERPPEPRVTATPRSAWTYTQRVAWALPADSKAEDWPDDLIARTEPVANAMAAELLGKAEDFKLKARVIGPAGAPIAGEAPRSVKLADLGLSPLALARAATAASGQGPSPLELRVIGAMTASAPLPAGSGLEFEPAGAAAPNLAELLALLRAIRPLVFGRPALGAHSLQPPAGPVPEGNEDNALKERVKTLKTFLEEQIAILKPAMEAKDYAALTAVVRRAAIVAPAPDWAINGAPASDAEILTAATALSSTIEGWTDRWDEPPVDPAASTLEKDAARIRLVLGSDFPVLPPFTLEDAAKAELKASLDDQAALTGGLGVREIRRWRRALGLVRPRLRALNFAFDAARGAKRSRKLRVAQLPHETGARWASLPFERTPPRQVQLSLVLAGDAFGSNGPVAGVLIDDWTEAVPEQKTATSLSFHYDAPAARPPQSILLAVDAGLGDTGWSADALVATVIEAFDLARLRLLPPSKIPGHGALLPTTFLPRNLSEEMPSLDLLGLAASVAGRMDVLGKAGQ